MSAVQFLQALLKPDGAGEVSAGHKSWKEMSFADGWAGGPSCAPKSSCRLPAKASM